MSFDHIPIFDKHLAIKLAGNNEKVAEEILNLLVNRIARDLAEINSIYAVNDLPLLQKKIHKLHGALCYCGLPRLKQIASEIELGLKQKRYETLAENMEHLNKEVTVFLNANYMI